MAQYETAPSPSYVKLIWDGRYKVLGSAIICGLLGLVQGLIMPEKYESSATVLIYPPLFKEMPQSGARPSEDQPARLAELMPTTLPVETYRVLALSPDLVKEVIAAAGLEDMGMEDLRDDLAVDLDTLGVRTPQWGTMYSQTLTFTGKAKNPQLVADIIQTWVGLFKKRVDDLALSSVVETSQLVDTMWTGNKEELEKAEDLLVAFNKKWNLNLLALERTSKEELLAELETESERNETKIATKSSESGSLQQQLAEQLEQNGRIESLFKAPPDEAYWLSKKLGSEGEEATLGPKDGLLTQVHNPDYLTIKNRKITTDTDLQGLRAANEDLLVRMEKLRGEIDLLQRDLAEQNTASTRLKRDVEMSQQTYGLVARQREKAKIAMVNRKSDIEIIGNAVVPDRPAGMRSIHTVFVSCLIGAFLAIGYIAAEHTIRVSATDP